MDLLEQSLEPSLASLFGPEVREKTASRKEPRKQNGKRLGQGETGLGDRQKSEVFEDSFAYLFRSSPIGISIHRLHSGQCIDCNESFARILSCAREELIGREVLELAIPADILNPIDDLDHSSLQKSYQASARFERQIFQVEKSPRYVLVHIDRVEFSGETCLLCMVQDITEKEEAKEKINCLNEELERLVLVRTGALEAANRELEAEIEHRKSLEDFSNQLSQIIWETPDVVIVYGADWRVQFLNKAGRDLFDLSENAPVDTLDFFSAYSQEMRRCMFEEIQPILLQEGIWRGETTFQRADGRVIPLSQVFLCQKDDEGKVLYFATIARDVSDFKQVEQELRQSRERYRTLAEAAHDFIFVVSKDGQMEYANEYACRALNYEPDRVAGMPAGQFFPKEFSAIPLPTFSNIGQIDQPVYTEGPFTQNGQQSWLGTWLVPIYNDQADLVSVMGISRDITEQKKTDEALQRALQNERRLGETRSNFFSMTSHQFRTPLSTIMLSADVLLKYGQKWDEQKRAEHLNRIRESSQRFNNLLEDILVIGRLESGRYVCSPKAFDLVNFCERAIAEMTLNDRDEHEFVFQHEGSDCPIYQDPEVMHRVVDNLLSNAIKYSPKGTRVILGIRIEGSSVMIEVTDQGIGIPDEDLKYLFQPFQRGSNAGGFPGTGIGLTIIQKSVELMNGSITLKSKEGQGTTFLIRFPAQYER